MEPDIHLKQLNAASMKAEPQLCDLEELHPYLKY
jgi:hypothetical protein